MQFKFDDEKSRKQINHYGNHCSLNVKRQNRENLNEFYRRWNNMTDGGSHATGDEINGIAVNAY